jgi:alkylated DNA repair dioxygenase AlkB
MKYSSLILRSNEMSLVPKCDVHFATWVVENDMLHLNNFMRNVKWEYKTHPKRGVAMYGKDYKYSGIVVKGSAFPKNVQALMDKINFHHGLELNSCLLNYYPDGSVGIGLHSDEEEELVDGKDTVVVSVNLGATRNFILVDNVTKEEYVIPLPSGSVLIMGAGCQRYYKHKINVDHTITDARVNMTFRQFM